MRQCGASKIYGSKEVGAYLVGDLFVAQLFCRAKQTIAGVADYYVDGGELSECAVDYAVDLCSISHVQVRHPQVIAISAFQIVHCLHFAYGSRNAVSSIEKALGHCSAKAAVDSSNEPG